VASITSNESNSVPGNGMLTITRVFDAPRQLVFQAFTDPKHAVKWLGPRHCPAVHFEADLRPGGSWRGCLRGGEGDEWHGGVYREIVPPERLVYTFAWDNSDGKPGRETLITVTFAEHGSKTLMTFSQGVFNTDGDIEGHGEGWNSSFDRLAEYVDELTGAS